MKIKLETADLLAKGCNPGVEQYRTIADYVAEGGG